MQARLSRWPRLKHFLETEQWMCGPSAALSCLTSSITGREACSWCDCLRVQSNLSAANSAILSHVMQITFHYKLMRPQQWEAVLAPLPSLPALPPTAPAPAPAAGPAGAPCARASLQLAAAAGAHLPTPPANLQPPVAAAAHLLAPPATSQRAAAPAVHLFSPPTRLQAAASATVLPCLAPAAAQVPSSEQQLPPAPGTLQLPAPATAQPPAAAAAQDVATAAPERAGAARPLSDGAPGVSQRPPAEDAPHASSSSTLPPVADEPQHEVVVYDAPW